jgi:ATP-dependent Clp protease, protease subunit
MSRNTRDTVDQLHDYGIHVPTRTLYLGSESRGDNNEESGVDFLLAERIVKNLHILEFINKEPINIVLNNVGGDWYHGMAIHDAIKNSGCHVTITVYGQAMSMATIILQAADERVMMPNAELMIHDGSESHEGSPRSFEAWAKQSKKSRKKMYDVYAERSKMPSSFWEKKCGSDYFLSASDAVKLGLADSILEPPEPAKKD